MKGKATLWLSMGVLLLLAAPLGAAQSLGDAARAQKEKKDTGTKKPAKVYTNDDFPSGNVEPAQPTMPGKPASPKARSSFQIPTLTVDTSTGWSVPLSPENGTDLIFMATWCPHSKALKEILNDPRSRPYWAENKLVFLFSKNEWGREKLNLDGMAKEGKIRESDVPVLLEQLKSKAGSPYVMDPKFLDNLPGDYYYFSSVPKEVPGYPTALSVHGYANRMDWLVKEHKMPEELFLRLRDEYDADTSNSSAQ